MAANQGDPRLEAIEPLFPQLDLTEVATQHSTYSTDELIDWILRNINNVPVKKKLQRSSSAKTFKSEAAKTVYSEIIENSLDKNTIQRFFTYLYRYARSFVHLLLPKRKPDQECGICFDKIVPKNAISCTGEGSIHSFCRSCIRQQAKACTEEAPLAEGGNLKCMEYKCENVILLAVIKPYIPRKVLKRIDDRILEEALGKCGISIERCKACNFAMEIDVPTKVNKVFNCLKCFKNWCRICGNDWDDAHFGVDCAEYQRNQGQAAKTRALANKINEAVVRKCNKCNFQFVKSQGCNKVVCRCGIAYCYICKLSDITYDHFCKCFGEASQCVCGKCRLHLEAEHIHDKEIKEITASFKQH